MTKHDANTLDDWIRQRCDLVADDGRRASSWLTASLLFADFAGWVQGEAGPATGISRLRWGKWMRERGFRQVRSNGSRFVGILLKPKDCSYGN